MTEIDYIKIIDGLNRQISSLLISLINGQKEDTKEILGHIEGMIKQIEKEIE